ncbi:hypothetical protein EVJ58_g6962, partial [Rhodofomes roseus]
MLSDWESDLTDLSSSDEEEYVPPSQKKKTTARARNTGNDYKVCRTVTFVLQYSYSPFCQVTNTLRPPRTTQYTAKSLFDQMMDNTIDLDPEYQRDIVWSDSKQSGLIDSILRNYYIPPVIFGNVRRLRDRPDRLMMVGHRSTAVTAKEDGSESRTCIDGKQRLTSIANFFNGVISHRDSKTNTRYWYKDGPARGVKRKILPKQYQQVFANKQITCVEYEGLTDDQEREIFQRVQLGVALTPAERLQALTGHRATLIREIQVKVLGSEGFGSNLEWANGRGRDFQCLASIVYLIEQQSQTFPHVTQLEKWLQSVGALPVKFESDIMETFQVWVTMVRDKHFNTPFSKPTRVSPIEFTIIGVLIHKHRSTLSMLQLSNAISQMRADVRSQHVDIRANSKVTKTMLTFINKKMKTIDIQGDGKGDISATTFVRSKAGENGTATGKRKRAIVPSSEEEESSDDEDDVPLRRKAPAKKKAATTRATTTKSAVSAKPAVTSTSSKTAATKTTIKLPARSAVSKPATPASTAKPATSASKVTVKQVTVSTSAKSAKTSPTVSQSTSTVKKKEPSATTAVTGTPTATPTMPSKAVPAAEVTQVKSSPNTTSPAPLALPRRTPLPNGMAASGSRSASVSVKTEPGVEAALQSPTVNRGGGIAASPLDRLAAIRAAKANIGSRSVSGPAAVPAAGRSAPAAASLPRTSPPNILDNVAPIVKQERPQLSNINTNVAASIHQQPPAAQPGPSSTSSSRLPTPALPPPSTVASSARSTPSVSTPTGLPAPPVHIQQTTGKQPSFDAVYLGDLFKEHRIGIYAHQAFPPANQPQAQLNHQPTLPASAPNGSTAEDVVMGDATSRAASVMPQLSTEQVLSTIPPHVLSAIQLAQQSASAPPFPNNGMPTAPP